MKAASSPVFRYLRLRTASGGTGHKACGRPRTGSPGRSDTTALFNRHIVFLDLETTGGSAARDRIIEIGLIEVDCGRVVTEWSTLVNPGRYVPQGIQTLTGISNDMLTLAPSFAAVSAALAQRLTGKVLVAHNAGFDYGFLKTEFERSGVRYRAPVLCTVKLSRRLFPQHRHHNLDALIVRHALFCIDRHRALGDAQVLWELAQIWQRELGADTLDTACADLLGAARVPPGLPADIFDALPEAPGVYVFHGDDGRVLYAGKGVNIRSRVMAHFSGTRRPASDARIAAEVKRIECMETAGELGARIMQAHLVKTLTPAYNRKPRRSGTDAEALALAAKPWPYAGRIAVREHNRGSERCELHVLDEWRYLGTAHSDADLHELACASNRSAFDPDTYRMLARFLSSPPRTCEIVSLERRTYD